MANQSGVTEFYFQGFPGLPPEYNIMAAFILFFIYMASFCVNSTVISLIAFKEILHQPMYILMGFLALSDLISDTTTLPKIISRYWFDDGFIAFSSCFFQMFLFHVLNALDSLIILLMSFDRYVAICRPLHYHAIITTKAVFVFYFIASGFCISVSFYVTFKVLLLSYCGPNNIKNVFCTVVSVAVLSCGDSSTTRQHITLIGTGIHLVSLGYIVFSYVVIISQLCTSGKPVSWKKVFYTCTSHWIVIIMYIIPRLVVYFFYVGQFIPNSDVNVLLICLYTYIPHVSSPIIFCLTTEKVKGIMISVFKKMISGD